MSDDDSLDIAALAASDFDLGLDHKFTAGSNPNAADAIEELQRLHRQKVNALIRSNTLLKKELAQAQKEGQDNYRVKMIKALRQQLRESQALVDELTKQLMEKSRLSEDEVGEIFDQVLSQPKLAKPNNPAKLKKDVRFSE